jgi:PKD repeat protein
MEAPHNYYPITKICKNRGIFLAFVILFFLSLPKAHGQAPTWVPTTPSIGTTGPISIPINYGINITGTVYIIVINYDFVLPLTSANVKTMATQGPSGVRTATAVIPIVAGQTNLILQRTLDVVNANRLHSVFLVAESSSGVLQATPVKLLATTLPCPKIDGILTGFSQPFTCVTQGATARFNVAADPDPMVSGILKGTTWYFDWGDGTTATYTSASDNDIPALATYRTHTYTSVTNCNYLFSNTIRNPCGETRTVQYIAVIHGRDIPADGDGMLRIVNNANGNSVIQVCEGTQTVVTLRDNSIWNCQNPVLPGGVASVPNSDPRNIEWLYGRDPSGSLFNTITGSVAIASLGNAPQYSGRMLPSPYGPSSQSQAITIPATCRAGEYFRVYLKNWNKCNWADADYVSTYVDINVVAAPPAPTAPNKTICYGGNRTLSVTSTPIGQIRWYSNSSLTTLVGTGTTYTPTQTAVGNYSFWVVDRSTTGLRCQSAATQVTLTINPIPLKPSINHPTKNDICYDGVETYTMTAVPATPPAITSYQWYKDGVAIPGETSQTIVLSQPSHTGSYTVSTIGIAPSNCPSPQSDPWYVTVHTLSNLTNPVPVTICQNQSAVFSAFTTDEVQNWQWEVSTNGGASFTTVGNGPPYSGFTTNTLTITTPPPSYNGYLYRVEIKTPPGQGGCAFKSASARLTVDALPTATAGPQINRCSNSPTDPIYMTGSAAGGTFTSVIWSGGGGLGTWTQNNNPAQAYFTPSVPSGTFTATLRVTGTAACSGVVATVTQVISWSQTPTADAGTNISRCSSNPYASVLMTGAVAGGSYSAATWTGGSGLGTWSQNINPALATFTPSTTSGSFTATLTVYGKDGCLGTNPTDTRTITWGQTPVADAGADISRCDLNPLANIAMTGALATGTYTNVVWTGGGVAWTQNSDPALATYKPTANYGSFTATLSISGTGACTGSNASDTRLVEWSYAATVNAGPDQSICATAPVTLAGSIGGSAVSATWSGGTGTYNPNNTALNAVYTPSLAERTAHTVTLILTTNDPAGICPSGTDNVTISIGTQPTAATMTSSGDACFGSGASWINIAINGGASPYTISYRLNGTNMPDITGYTNGTNRTLGILPVGNYTYEILSIRDNCGNLLNTNLPGPHTIHIYQNPVANPGPDRSLCGTLTASLAAVPSVGTGTWTVMSGPGTITFNPNANSPTATITAGDYGSYVLRWTEVNGGICSSYSEIAVSFERAANAGPAQDLCGTLSATLAGNAPAVGTGTWTLQSGPGTVTFSPNNHLPGASATVSTYGSYVFRWTLANGVFCSTNQTVTVGYNPSGQVNKPADIVICDSSYTSVIAFTTANTGGTTSYAWSNDNTSIGLGSSGNGNIPSFRALNAGTDPVKATITVTPTYQNGTLLCPGISESFTITVNPTAQVNQPANVIVCNGSPVSVPFSTVNETGVTSYSWTNSVTAIGLPSIGNGNISFSAINTTNSPIIATVRVTPVFNYGGTNCPGPVKTFTITVNPTGQVNQPANLVVCNGVSTTVSFTTANINGTTTYAWSNNNTAIGLGAGGTDGFTFTAENSGTTPVSATVSVTPTFTNGSVSCPGTTRTFTITVNPTPTLTSPLTIPDICSNVAITYSPSASVTGTTFRWDRGIVTGITPAGPTTSTGSINETLRNRTNMTLGVIYQYTLAANGCSNVQNVSVNVKPEPVIVSGQTAQTCSRSTVSYHINLVNFTNPDDEVVFTWPAPVLNPASLAFTGGTARNSASADDLSDTFVNRTGAAGTATYTVTPYKDGCAGTPVNIVVTVNPEPILDPGLNLTVCSNTPVGLILKVAAGSVSADHYNISKITLEGGLSAVAGNAAIANNSAPANYLSNDRFLNITGVNKNVTYRIQPVNSSGCQGDSVNVVVTIRPQPYIEPAQIKTVCSGVAIGKEILLSPANVPAGTLFNWPAPTMSDMSSQGTAGNNVAADPAGKLHINDVIYNYSAIPIRATYYITPVSSPYGCQGATIPVIITINPEPAVKAISGRDKICVGETNIVYNVSTASGSIFHWTVAPGVGTKTFDFNTNAILVNAASVPGSGNITVYETNSFTCDGDLSTLPVQVYSRPLPENINGDPDVCATSTHTYSVTSRSGSTYNWSIPGGAAISGDPTAASITVIFGNVGGTISVSETNIAGCVTNHNPLTVNVRPLPTAVISGGGTICEGSAATVSVALAGTGPFTFTYAINGVSQAPVNAASGPYVINATQSGTYTIVNITDATNCTNSGVGSALVTYYMRPTGTLSGGAEFCRGGRTLLTMVFTGTPPYTFTYSDGTNSLTVPNYPNSVYTVTVSPLVSSVYTLTELTDGHTCSGALSGSAPVTVNIPPALTINGTNLTCNNDNTGAVNMTVTGTGPFGYYWTGPDGFIANTRDLAGLKAGTYSVTVTDTKGCISTGSVTLTEPAAIGALLNSTDIYCYGSPEGTITISLPYGGSGVYEYTIDGGLHWGSASGFTGLNPGTYDVRMRDVMNPVCFRVLNGALVLTGPAELRATVTSVNIICNGANNGSISISNPSGGFGTYAYSIDGGISWQGSGNFINLHPGTYNIRMMDAAHTSCAVSLNPPVVITEPGLLTATLTSTNVSCFGRTDGSITISDPAGGHGTYQYSINGGGSWQNTGTYTGLAPGSYNVQIRDLAYPSCYRILNSVLVITQPAVLRASLSSTMVTCNGADDGSISITGATGGSGNFEYTIHGGSPWVSSGLFTDLAPGSYDVRIRDAANITCETILNNGLEITEPTALSAMVVKSDITCHGAADGRITVTNPLGGYGTYEFSDDGGVGWQLSNIFTGLGSGAFNVRMRDRSRQSCVLILGDVIIIEPDALSASLVSTNINCFNANNGTITVSSPLGGSGSYQYTVNGGASWEGTGNYSNLPPAAYDVRIRDAINTGCVLVLNSNLVLTQPVVLSATATRTNVTCFGASNGTITVNGASGGSGSFGYTINGGIDWQAGNVFTGLNPGFYNVMIRDAVNPTCIFTVNGSLSITQPSALNATVSRTNITCHGADDGTITVSSPTGGYGAYEFTIHGNTQWQSSGNFTGLSTGNYDVRIRDAAQPGCVIQLNSSLAITEPDALAATMNSSNVTCYGADNGSISITGAAGGSGTYEYSINGGSIWAGTGNFVNLVPATYIVQMRDAVNKGCILALGSVTINQPVILSATVTKTDISCYGGGNGTIIISSPGGGYGTYEYSINGGGSWQTTGSYSGLGPGVYNVQIRDGAQRSCVIVLDNALTITQPAVLNAVVTPTMVTCFGANDGIINVTSPSGGYGTYEYSIDGGILWSTTGLFTNLPPATYEVRIRDEVNKACVIILRNSLVISQPPALNAVLSSTNITCNAAHNGTITISVPSGGYGTFDFTINGTDWQASGSFTNLNPGHYNVQMRDRAHPACIRVLNNDLVISEPSALTGIATATNVTCNSANNGTISIISPGGGYGTYDYSIDGGVTWQQSGLFTGLIPGSYNVRIRDAANISCYAILANSLSITQPAALAATVTSTNVTCFNSDDGTITISTASGGYGHYDYTINGGSDWQASGSFTDLDPGFYNVQMRDADNPACIRILNSSLRITEPGSLSAAVTKTDITCFGEDNGTITISLPSGGSGIYRYSIDGGLHWQSSGNFTDLPPSSYNVIIGDANNPGCSAVLNPALSITQPAELAGSVTGTDATCNGSNDGTIIISGAAGGYGTYQYTINGGLNWSSSGVFTSLRPQTYNVQLRDAGNPDCILLINTSLVINEPDQLDAVAAGTDITCFGSADGTIIVSSPSGGSGTYEYTINGGGSWQVSGTFTGLGPGNYNVQMRDGIHRSCIRILNNSLAITQPSMLNAVVTPTMVTCFGVNDGIINITSPTGGSGIYNYSINNGVNWSASGLFSGLAPGTYNVQIRDDANRSCITVLNGSLIITGPSQLDASVSYVNVTCNGAADGRINITIPVGGYGTYDYSVDGGLHWQTTGYFSGLAPGNFIVAIRDRAHVACVTILNTGLEITQPDVLFATINSTAITCYGSNNGTITITNPLGGYGTYAYSINGGSAWQDSGTFTNLAPGNYDVRIRDAEHQTCSVTLNPSLEITQPVVLSATINSTAVTCYGSNDGTITITNPTGGSGNYEYTITGGAPWQTTGSYSNLAPGFYNVQIRDAGHPDCIRTINGAMRITEPPVLSAMVSATNITCNGSNDGTITIVGASGGSGTYNYSIDGGLNWQPSGSFTGLTRRVYDVRIQDAAHPGCTITLDADLTITEPALLNATVTPVMISCNNASDGMITISNTSGGSGFYMFSIDGGTNWQGTGNFRNLAPSVYNVIIRDAVNLNCSVTLASALQITQPDAITANVAGTNITCFGGNDGTITISGALGGYGRYEYSINGGGSWSPSGSFTNLTPGSYNVLIRDADHTGCIVVLNNAFALTQPLMLSASVSKTDVSCNGDHDGTITITSPAGGYGTYEYSRNGGTDWQISGSFTNLGPGNYDIRIRDFANPACSAILNPSLVITEPLALSLTSTGDLTLDCNGDRDGIVTFYATGGTMPYTFVIDSNTTGGTVAGAGFNSQTIYNAGAGSITVTVVDLNMCSFQASVNISQPDLLTPGSISGAQNICMGSAPGILGEVTPPSGGSGGYIYQWQSASSLTGSFISIPGATSNTYTPPVNATYTLFYRRMVTSGVCLPVYSNVVEVRVNPMPIALLTGGETICPGQSSVLRINLPAGTGPFTIDIANHGTITGYTSGSDIVVTPAVTTTYRITRVRDANNCEITAPSANINGEATVTVNTLPVITSFTPSPAVCEYNLATFRVNATGTNLSYQWYVDERTGSFIPVSDGGTYFGSRTPTLQIFNSVRTMDGYTFHVVISGCGSSVTSADAVFNVNTAPEITLQPEDSTVCSGQNAVMEANATGTSITWQWYVNRGSGFVAVDNNSSFSGATTRILSITNATSSFNNYVFRAVATGICGAPVSTSFAVLRVINPPAVSQQPASRPVCEGSAISFFANGTGYTSLQWQVQEGTTGWINLTESSEYIGTNSQMLTIMAAGRLMDGNLYRLGFVSSCTVTYSDPAVLTVHENPIASISPATINACGGIPLTLNGNPQGGSGTYTNHRWTGDIGPLNNYFVQTPVFTTHIAGSYNLNYRVTDSFGCSGNGDLTVIVDSPDATFTRDVDNGCTPLRVTFTKDMTGIADWWWDFGDGTPVDSDNANPVHTFVNNSAGSIEYHTVKLRVQSTGGCYKEFSTTIAVYPGISAAFSASDTVVCSGDIVTFTGVPGAGKYFWDFGDGISGDYTATPNHLYTNFTTGPVVDTVSLITTSFYYCVDTQRLVITVMPVPDPQFAASPTTQVFNPVTGSSVTFTNTTPAGSWSWLWRFGDGTTSTDKDPVHIYNNIGTYYITLVAGNGICSDSIKHFINITPPAPVAMFDSIPPGCAPLFVNINNVTINGDVPGTTYRWDFDDGSTSTAKNPTYTYFTPGEYTVSLYVTGPGGSSEYHQVVYAYPSPKAYFEITPAKVYVNDENVRCFNLSQGATSVLWEFGDGDTTSVWEPFHKYMEEGVYDITLWAYSANGCWDKYILSPAVTVLPVGQLRYPSVFRPNTTGPIERTDLPTGGDEVDQFFYPPIRQTVLNYKLQIFNRWGVLIFESHDINHPWNGYYQGKLCQQGVYVWLVEGKYEDGKPFKMVGNVTLLQ